MKKILTVILDGYGYRDEIHGNAIKLANPLNMENLWKKYPHSLLYASEERMGLEKGQFGTSEVGHLTIGAGRKLKQPITMVKEFIEEKMPSDERYLNMLKDIKEKNKTLHIMGLLSNGLVHADIRQFIAVYNRLVIDGVTKIYFHIITDGRDTKPTISMEFMNELNTILKQNQIGEIATVCGRYYAMDRNHNWDRTKKYYDLVTKGLGLSTVNVENTIHALYEKNITDEFLEPIVVNQKGLIKNDDILLWMNYRTDRAPQILGSFTDVNFSDFQTQEINPKVYTFVPINKSVKTIHFLPDDYYYVNNPLGLYLSNLGLTQARIAETEKYAHVTYFFDGQYNGPIEGSTKYLIPSVDVPTFDLRPEMSAVEITKKVVSCMEKDIDFILVNYANADMVGHTGNLEATIKAIISVDLCLGKLLEKAEENFYKVIILADHGNADMMLDESDQPVTTHSLSKVPFIMVDDKVSLKAEGDLTNVAPTILEYMDIALPKEMKETESLFDNL